MKTIVLIPVKNEAWIIDNTLHNISPHVDHIIIADQLSTDNTREICAKYPNVTVIDNPSQGHSNQVRWLLLEEARKFGTNNLIICIDADEVIAPAAIKDMQNKVQNSKAQPGDVFNFLWLQLWKTPYQYMEEGPWKDNWKDIAFIDNPGINEYHKEFVINDHTSRVPDSHIHERIKSEFPLLHFHFLAWKRNQLKQAWYRCTELMHGKRNAKRINNTYRITLFDYEVPTFPLKDEWYKDLDLPEGLADITSENHLREIKEMFEKNGVSFFEDLQIWHIPELKALFVEKMGREPKSKTFPKWLSHINEFRHFLRKHMARFASLLSHSK